MGRGLGIAGVVALAILAVAIAAVAWLSVTGNLARVTSGTPRIVVDVPPAPPGSTPPAAAAPVQPQPAPQAAATTTPAAAPAPAATPAATTPEALPTWKRFARPFPAADTRPRIAIVVTGLGIVKEDYTVSAIGRLPPDVTVSFSPYGRKLPELMEAARKAGHEVLLELPMEPRTYPTDNPGPQALLTSLDDTENQHRLDWMLSQGQGYVGVATHMGSRFTADSAKLKPVLQTLANRGLLYLDSLYGAGSFGPQIAAELKMPRATNDQFIAFEESKQSRAAIDASLGRLEQMARTKGHAVATVLPVPVAIDALSDWAKGLEAKGLTLAPISAIAATGAPQ